MRRRLFEHSLVAVLIATCVFAPLSDAKSTKKPKRSWLPQCLGGNCDPTPAESFEPEAQMLISKLSHDPTLMNVEYLKYFIGRPHNEKHAKTSMNPHYQWYDENRNVKYELKLSQQALGEVTEADFAVHLAGMGVKFDDLSALYGEPTKRFYDYHASPAELYSFVPNTSLCFTSKPNTFRCSEAKISYRGTPLESPSQVEMTMAESAMVARSAAHSEEDPATQSLPLLQARVKAMPMDPEAHLALAKAYRMQSQLHPAIGEYKVALALSGTNQAVRDQAFSALRDMRVIDNYDPNEKRRLELVHQGQALKARGHQKPEPQQHP